MRYWICTNCGLIHSENTVKCECGTSILFFLMHRWLHFDSVEALEKWIKLMNTRMGAKLKYAGD